jgi:hypothetical protein
MTSRSAALSWPQIRHHGAAEAQAELRGRAGQFRIFRERAAQSGALLFRIGIDTGPLDKLVKGDRLLSSSKWVCTWHPSACT